MDQLYRGLHEYKDENGNRLVFELTDSLNPTEYHGSLIRLPQISEDRKSPRIPMVLRYCHQDKFPYKAVFKDTIERELFVGQGKDLESAVRSLTSQLVSAHQGSTVVRIYIAAMLRKYFKPFW